MSNVNVYAPFEAYKGDKPYIFVSYAHRDGEQVFPDIRTLNESGYRIWYDEGIDPGKEWTEDIANALDKCSLFLVFISENSISSRNVKNEINFALDKNIPLLTVYIENIELPPGLLLRMGSIQAILKWRITEEQYFLKLRKVISADLCDKNLIEESFKHGNYEIQYTTEDLRWNIEKLEILTWVIQNDFDELPNKFRYKSRLEDIYREVSECLKRLNYDLPDEEDKLDIDIQKLKELISILRGYPDIIIKKILELSLLYRVDNNYSKALKLLKPLLNAEIKDPFLKCRIRFEYGMILAISSLLEKNALCSTEGTKIVSETLNDFKLLPSEIRKDNERTLSFIYYNAGKLFQREGNELQDANELIKMANMVMPENPLFLVALLETNTLQETNRETVGNKANESKFKKAITNLHKLISLGIVKVPAWFAIGRCHFFLDNNIECLKAYSNAVSIIIDKHFITNRFPIDAEIEIVSKLAVNNTKLAEQILLFLYIALTIVGASEGNNLYMETLKLKYGNQSILKEPVVVVAGGVQEMDNTKLDSYRIYLKELLDDFRGTILCVGRAEGIPGLVGIVKDELAKSKPVQFESRSYLSGNLIGKSIQSNSFDLRPETNSDGFYFSGILKCWADIIISELSPLQVVLIGFDGDDIADLDFQISLSLGGKVGLISLKKEISSKLIVDEHWKNHPDLIILPKDPLTVWALANQFSKTILSKEDIVTLASYAHELYRHLNLKYFDSSSNDLNKYKLLLPWDKLDPNKKQIAMTGISFYELILKKAGLAIRKVENPGVLDIQESLKEEEFDHLAALEHSRWNAERLLEGWRYGSMKDIAKKLNPFIKAWKDLGDDIKKYDYDPVKNIPVLLAMIGYEVYKVD